MKTIYILPLVCLLALSQLCNAQKPEPVNGFAVEMKPVAWYKEQIRLWKKEIDRNNQDAYAWYNYYRATRNLSRVDTTDRRSSDAKAAEQKAIVDEMEKAVPNSYEYNLTRWLIAGNDPAYIRYLKKADELGAGRTEHLSDMLGWGEIERDIPKRNKYADIWYHSSKASPGMLYYNYNVISGLKPNAVIFTSGDNDTYPIWLLQSQGIRPDVTVLNTSLLMLDEYRNRILKELGASPWEKETRSSKKDAGNNASSVSDEQTYQRYRKEIVKHIAHNSKKYPVYVALTTGEEYTGPVEEQLYLTGLAYEYSEQVLDNMALLKRNFEQNYALDYLDKTFFQDISAYWVNHSSGNYMVPMLKLLEHYKTSGDVQHREWISGKIRHIAKGKPGEEQVLKYLSE
jgi:hypothetical protein